MFPQCLGKPARELCFREFCLVTPPRHTTSSHPKDLQNARLLRGNLEFTQSYSRFPNLLHRIDAPAMIFWEFRRFLASCAREKSLNSRIHPDPPIHYTHPLDLLDLLHECCFVKSSLRSDVAQRFKQEVYYSGYGRRRASHRSATLQFTNAYRQYSTASTDRQYLMNTPLIPLISG